MRAVVVWAALCAAIAVPTALAATSDLLPFRGWVYILAGLAGILALGLVLVQPLLIDGLMPGLSAYRARRVHRWVGAALLAMVLVHVAGLWITSPPDMIDALTYASPTPFSPFGVTAMWAIVATAALALVRRRFRLRTWRLVHLPLAAVIAIGSVVHALLIEGTMETISKAALCALVLAATVKAMVDVGRRALRGARETG
jgi:predicted ferric reductase